MNDQNIPNFTPYEEIEEEAPRYRLPLYAKILYIVAAVSVVVYIAALIWEPFADFFARYPGAIVRAVTAYLTGWIPFSFAEFLLLFSPVIVFFIAKHITN